MKVLVCGDRNWTDPKPIWAVLYGLWYQEGEAITVIEGCARGADSIACKWGLGHPEYAEHLHFPAKWDEHGKAAGPIRNRQMLKEGQPEVVYAFHDDLANSRGTRDMVTIAKKAGLPVYVMRHA